MTVSTAQLVSHSDAALQAIFPFGPRIQGRARADVAGQEPRGRDLAARGRAAGAGGGIAGGRGAAANAGGRHSQQRWSGW
eukprot:1373974-Pleurochrysis_carterae.AAC.1